VTVPADVELAELLERLEVLDELFAVPELLELALEVEPVLAGEVLLPWLPPPQAVSNRLNKTEREKTGAFIFQEPVDYLAARARSGSCAAPQSGDALARQNLGDCENPYIFHWLIRVLWFSHKPLSGCLR